MLISRNTFPLPAPDGTVAFSAPGPATALYEPVDPASHASFAPVGFRLPLRDPRVRDVTVIGVEMDADMRGALVKVSVMGDETKQRLALKGLACSAGFLQSRIADRIETKLDNWRAAYLDPILTQRCFPDVTGK